MWADPDRQAGRHCWEKPQSIPQRNPWLPYGSDNSWRSRGSAACLFGRLCLSWKTNSWSDSTAGGRAGRSDPRPPLPSPATSADSLAGYITFTNTFLFSSLLCRMALFSIRQSKEGLYEPSINLQPQSVYPAKLYATQTCGLRLINKLRVLVTHFLASCHLTGNKGPPGNSKVIFPALCHTSIALYLVFKRIPESFQNQNRSEVQNIPCKCSLRQAAQARWDERRLFLFAFLIHSKSIYLYT